MKFMHIVDGFKERPIKAGIDLGSRSVKIAVSLERRDDIGLFIFNTVDFYEKYLISSSDNSIGIDIEELGLAGAELVLTGYGREIAKIRNAKVISEIKAHVKGVIRTKDLVDFVLLDMGGQDTKVAEVAGGRIVNFRTNDRCAASTGRYLENMARILSMGLSELSERTENPAELSAVCAVFGETELLSLMAEGHTKNQLAAGVNHALARRIKPMIPPLKGRSLVISGGVSQSPAIVEIISDMLNIIPVIPPEPRFMGAIGCLLG